MQWRGVRVWQGMQIKCQRLSMLTHCPAQQPPNPMQRDRQHQQTHQRQPRAMQ
jgi:hypothetical protein